MSAADLGVDPQLYPFTGRWLELPNARMHYLDEGPTTDASTLLMVHGNPTWSFFWRDVVKAFAAKRRCVVPDHIGMGLSDKPPDEAYSYTMSQRVEDLAALVEEAIPDGKITLLVHDWGGMIGLAWAVRNSARIERIVVLNTSAFLPGKEISLPWQLKLARSPLGTLAVQRGNAFSIGATLMCSVKPLPANVKHGYRAPYRSFDARLATLRFVQDIPLAPGDRAWDAVAATDKGLASLDQLPILIQWGMRDFVFHRGFLEQFRKRWPHAEVDEYDAGHYVLEDETAAVIGKIAAFIGHGGSV